MNITKGIYQRRNQAKTTHNLTKDNPERIRRDLTITELRSQGKSVREIGQEVGISKQRVSQILNDKEIKEILDDTQRYYVSKAPEVKKEFIRLCLGAEKESDRVKAIGDYNKIIGITPMHTQSPFIQQIYVDNRTVTSDTHQGLADLLALKRKNDLSTPQTIDIDE